MAKRPRVVEHGHSPVTGRCARAIQEEIETEMARQGLGYTDLAARRGMGEAAARLFLRSLGTKRHSIKTLAKWSLALNKPAEWLLELLRKHGLR